MEFEFDRLDPESSTVFVGVSRYPFSPPELIAGGTIDYPEGTVMLGDQSWISTRKGIVLQPFF
jgi:hypothetical protein